MAIGGVNIPDSTHLHQEARVCHLTNKLSEKAQPKKTILKRRIGYYEEEVSVTHAKLSHMEIDANKNAVQDTVRGKIGEGKAALGREGGNLD